MSMVPSDYSFSDLLLQLANEGAVPMSRIDDADAHPDDEDASWTLRDPVRGVSVNPAIIGAPASRATALHAAHESIVLLKNGNNVLPLGAAAHVLGDRADGHHCSR